MGAINIVLPPPHRPDRYINLLKSAFKVAKPVKLLGDWVGLIGSLRDEEYGQEGKILFGEFYKYVNLDVTRNWFNVKVKKPAEKADLQKIQIPEELKPHFQVLPFAFFPKGHRLVAVTHDRDDHIAISQAQKIVKGAFAHPVVKRDFGDVQITIEPALESLDQILTIPRLRKLELHITPPNPDDFDEIEKQFYEELESQNAGKLDMIYSAASGETLQPNEKTKTLAKIAKSNGSVTGTGGTHGKTKIVSTKEHPLEVRTAYDADVELLAAEFTREAAKVVRDLRANK